MEKHLLWIPLLPFLGFLVNGLLGRRLGNRVVSWIGCLAPLFAFLVTFSAWSEIRGGGLLRQRLFDWIAVSDFSASFGFLFDPISAVMCLVVTGVGTLIHIYSTGYMKGDPGYSRFFAYLNLFTAFMLILVLADNLLLMFVGWEGVGLCSYLLIGFWFQSSENCDAGRKAFIVNRVGDFGFLIGIFLVFGSFQTLDLLAINGAVGTVGPAVLTAITLLLFIGATGKSAQIPLHIWLPDAMAGPTPVSALIHAATMVTAGVYLCCRLNPLFAASPTTMAIIAGIGGATALMAALIALTQNDIKKILAYSTVSQLGYMFFAVGVAAFGAAFFHLVTHAFFKALLFLGAGAVIHAVHHEQDVRKMGGLRHKLPFTHFVMLVGTAAIAGVPFFSGFFSKDEILFMGLDSALHGGGVLGWVLWLVTVLTAGLTAFYMLRLIALTFWGVSRVDPEVAPHVHEPGGGMGFALFVLAILSFLGGYIGLPEFLGGHNILGHFTGLHATGEHSVALEWGSMLVSILVATTGLFAAWYFYGKGRETLRRFVEETGVGRRLSWLSANKFFVDELYSWIILKPFHAISWILFLLVDRLLVDGILVTGSAWLNRTTGEFFRRMQSGFIPAYLLTFGCGAVVLLFLMLYLLKEGL